MLFFITICLMFSMLTSFSVLLPLFIDKKSNYSMSGFSCEEELKDMLTKRHMLLEQLIANDDPLQEEQLINELEIVCMHFQNAGLPALPLDQSKKFDFMSLILPFLFFITTFISSPSYAFKNEKIDIPHVLLHENNHISQINQFIINPGLGELIVSYRALFSTPKDEEFPLLLSLPIDFYSLEIQGADNSTFYKDKNNYYIKSLWKKGVHNITAQFKLPAHSGYYEWNLEQELAGLVVILMHEPKTSLVYDFLGQIKGLSRFFQKSYIVNKPEGFNWQFVDNNMPNSPDVRGRTKQKTETVLHGFRLQKDPYRIGAFRIDGILPKRDYLYIIIGFQGFWLVAVLLGVVLYQNRKKYLPE